MSTAIGLTPDGSGTVHSYTTTIHRTTQITTNMEECGPCPVFASFTLAFALQLKKKQGKISVRVVEECKVRVVEERKVRVVEESKRKTGWGGREETKFT